jgi:hypothetical protein
MVHHGALWFNREFTRGDIKRLAKTLLDAGIEVRGYWADCDYRYIDPRISSRDERGILIDGGSEIPEGRDST